MDTQRDAKFAEQSFPPETDDAVGELRGRPKPNLEVRVSRNTSITSASEGERLSRMSATSVSQTPDRGKRLWRI